MSALNSPTHSPDGARSWEVHGARFEIRSLSPTVTYDRITGILDEELARIVAAAHDELFALGTRPHTFHDWSGVSGYAPGARKFLTVWLDASRGLLRSAHILFSSRVLAMGIAAANVVLGGFIDAYGDPEAFRAACQKALQGE